MTRVALVILNDLAVDTRVRKAATALAASGLEVSLLGVTEDPAATPPALPGVDAELLLAPVELGRRPLLVGYRSRAELAAARPRSAPARLVHRLRSRGLDLVLRRGSRGPAALRPVQEALVRVLPPRRLADVEAATPPLRARLAALDPDVVHVHDVHLLEVAADHVQCRRAAGRAVRLVYDAREHVPGQPVPPPGVVRALTAVEERAMPAVDAVVTVSEPIADELVRRFGLARRPVVVVNGPAVPARPGGEPDVRRAAGLADAVPLAVYSGGLARPRGVHTVVDALPGVDGLHLAVVARAESSYTRHLVERAGRLGVADRLHVVPYVEPDDVPTYLAGADLGLIPLLHAANHDWALTNKLFEYVAAGLPVVTSDCEVQERFVREHRIGTVFRAGDAADCARALHDALAGIDGLRAAVRDPAFRRAWSWEVQAERLRQVYRDLPVALPGDPGAAGGTIAGQPRPTAPGRTP